MWTRIVLGGLSVWCVLWRELHAIWVHNLIAVHNHVIVVVSSMFGLGYTTLVVNWRLAICIFYAFRVSVRVVVVLVFFVCSIYTEYMRLPLCGCMLNGSMSGEQCMCTAVCLKCAWIKNFLLSTLCIMHAVCSFKVWGVLYTSHAKHGPPITWTCTSKVFKALLIQHNYCDAACACLYIQYVIRLHMHMQ